MKHSDGHILTEKELKFLSLTSQELNRFIDKDLYQKYVDLLTPEFIGQLEINISEQIIEDYLKAREIIVKEREKYLVKKNKECREHLMRSREEQKRRQNSQKVLALNQRHQEITKKAILEKFFGTMGGNKLNDEDDPQEEIQRNKKKKSMMSMAISSIKDSDTKKNAKMKSSIYGDISESAYYKMKHPSSKLLLLSRSFGDESLGKAMITDQKRHRIKSTEPYEEGYTFKMFQNYSSGPHQSNVLEIKKNQQARVRAARIIQKNWRGFKARSTFKKARMLKLDKLDPKLFLSMGQENATRQNGDSRNNSASLNRPRTVQFQSKTTSVGVKISVAKGAEHASVQSSNRSEVRSNRIHGLSRQQSMVSVGRRESASPKLQSAAKRQSTEGGNVFSFHPTKVSSYMDDLEHQPAGLARSKSGYSLTLTAAKSPLNQISEETYKQRQPKLRSFIKKPKFAAVITEELGNKFCSAVEDNDYNTLVNLHYSVLRRLVNRTVEQTNKYPVEFAINHGNIEMLILFLDCGFSIMKCPPLSEKSLVLLAQKNAAEGGLKRKEVVQYLRTLFDRNKIDDMKEQVPEAAKLWFQV